MVNESLLKEVSALLYEFYNSYETSVKTKSNRKKFKITYDALVEQTIKKLYDKRYSGKKRALLLINTSDIEFSPHQYKIISLIKAGLRDYDKITDKDYTTCECNASYFINEYISPLILQLISNSSQVPHKMLYAFLKEKISELE